MRSTERRLVVVGIDQSDHAKAAVAWAADHARRRHLALHVIHAYETAQLAMHPPLGYAPGYQVELDHAILESGRRLLEHTAHQLSVTHPGLEVETELVAGSAGRALIDASAQAETVVVGSRGTGGFADLLLGSTALHVATHARCPVIAVPDTSVGSRSGVVVGVDGSEVSSAAVEWAFRAADELGEPLTAVHAWAEVTHYDPSLLPLVPSPEELERLYSEEECLLAESLAGLREKHPDVTVTARLVRGHPVRALLDEGSSAALVVVGSHGRGALRGLVLGSVSHGVLHHARGPVAVVRPENHPH